jgi:hypothetical protein
MESIIDGMIQDAVMDLRAEFTQKIKVLQDQIDPLTALTVLTALTAKINDK